MGECLRDKDILVERMIAKLVSTILSCRLVGYSM